jgi:uncharacterized membrane protein YhiD involved in acid resistance
VRSDFCSGIADRLGYRDTVHRARWVVASCGGNDEHPGHQSPDHRPGSPRRHHWPRTQWRQRGAGLRTDALVSIGASAFVTLSALMPGEDSPTCIAAQVVSGIGFLGAGVILREGLNIRGMNTAGTLWCSAAVGALAGSGFSAVAGITTAVVVMTNTALRSLGPRIERHQASGTEVEVSYQLNRDLSRTGRAASSNAASPGSHTVWAHPEVASQQQYRRLEQHPRRGGVDDRRPTGSPNRTGGVSTEYRARRHVHQLASDQQRVGRVSDAVAPTRLTPMG